MIRDVWLAGWKWFRHRLIGWHSWPRYVDAYTQAPHPVTCPVCGKEYS